MLNAVFYVHVLTSVHMYLCYVVLCQVSVNCSCHRSTWSGRRKLTPSRSTALVKTGGRQSTVLVKTGGRRLTALVKTGGGNWLHWLKQGVIGVVDQNKKETKSKTEFKEEEKNIYLPWSMWKWNIPIKVRTCKYWKIFFRLKNPCGPHKGNQSESDLGSNRARIT